MMAVLKARSIAHRLVRIQKEHSLYLASVEAMREEVIKTIVSTLWRRYREFQKRGDEKPRSFVDWLEHKAHFEETFLGVTGLPTRRRWAIGYFDFLTRKELRLADDPSDLWMFDALEKAINAKHDDLVWEIIVEAVPRAAIPRYKVKEGVALRFRKVWKLQFFVAPDEPEEEEE